MSKENKCTKCGKPTDGAWSEGGVKWQGLCEDCLDSEAQTQD